MACEYIDSRSVLEYRGVMMPRTSFSTSKFQFENLLTLPMPRPACSHVQGSVHEVAPVTDDCGITVLEEPSILTGSVKN